MQRPWLAGCIGSPSLEAASLVLRENPNTSSTVPESARRDLPFRPVLASKAEGCTSCSVSSERTMDTWAAMQDRRSLPTGGYLRRGSSCQSQLPDRNNPPRADRIVLCRLHDPRREHQWPLHQRYDAPLGSGIPARLADHDATWHWKSRIGAATHCFASTMSRARFKAYPQSGDRVETIGACVQRLGRPYRLYRFCGRPMPLS
ncbi:hypothetical protein ACVWW6_009007 [Bradyrhizobium sp. USDA 3311]